MVVIGVRNGKYFRLLVHSNGFGVYTGPGLHDAERQQVYSVTIAADSSLVHSNATLTYLALASDGYLYLNVIDRVKCASIAQEDILPGEIAIKQKWNSTVPPGLARFGDERFVAVLRSDGRLAVGVQRLIR